jgi:hypothetical protein
MHELAAATLPHLPELHKYDCRMPDQCTDADIAHLSYHSRLSYLSHRSHLPHFTWLPNMPFGYCLPNCYHHHASRLSDSTGVSHLPGANHHNDCLPTAASGQCDLPH